MSVVVRLDTNEERRCSALDIFFVYLLKTENLFGNNILTSSREESIMEV
jgi:hypothetical protein